MGLEEEEEAEVAYLTLGNLLRDLWIDESPEKAIPPTTCIEFLGVRFDLVKMVISVTPERLAEILREVQTWKTRTRYSRKELEKLLGRLAFISKCVRPGRNYDVADEK